jgi:hypothetical protein
MDVGRIAAVVLGLAFLWAGVAKLADREWPGAAAAFGVPRPVARVIGPFEVGLGAVLVTIGGRALGFCTAAVLVAYTGVLARKLAADGDAPPCACFGGLRARPISWRTLVRNAALLVLAALVAAG